MTVVTEDEIREKNYTTLEEVLRHVPGVDVQRSGGLGKTAQIRIRGAGTQQVQVMVDGMRVKTSPLRRRQAAAKRRHEAAVHA